MGSPGFPKLRGENAQSSRTQDNISQQLQPIAQALAKTPIMGAPAPGWIAPSLLNGFANLGTVGGNNYAVAGYHRDALGYVHIKGVVMIAAGAAAGLPIFALPGGYRPAEWNRFAVDGNGATFNALTVHPDGRIWPELLIAAGGTIDLAISFLAEQ